MKITEGAANDSCDPLAESSEELTGEEVNFILNQSRPVATALKLLFREGDTIEVRAWDKNHDVYTGRYGFTKSLAKAIEFLDAEGCDVYYVLNPVGMKLGLRDIAPGGLCTWESGVPRRRWFLMDFDPRREDKIATDAQSDAAVQAANAAKKWLEGYGWRGIALASSGNGAHLLVPCELPNDAASKELIRKVQRVISERFSNDQVEAECFPDANRLVRAYGTQNKKGAETELLTYRESMLLAKPVGCCDPMPIMERILAENPVAEIHVNRHKGEGQGPFTRDSLFERLQAWKEGWEGPDGEDFEYEETDRRDGFRIVCPGNLEDGWPDGEEHDDKYGDLNDSTIVWVDNGWPCFRCAHNHCGDGAEHGKKTWKDLQDFYDPQRRMHQIIEEIDLSAWNIEYVDDGAQNVEEASIEEVLGLKSVVPGNAPLAPVDLKVIAKADVSKDLSISGNGREPQPRSDEAAITNVDPIHFPESCMYGWLANKARELETPLGFAYPAMLTVFAATITSEPSEVRPTMFTCLIGPVHCGKSETIKRAIASFDYFDSEVVKWTVPGSDRGLINIFGGKKKKDKEQPQGIVGTKTRLLAQDELRNTIAKANISGSSLPSTLCSLWSQDEAGAADKTGEHAAMVKLNILGALKADDPEDFAEVFGKESTSGLYDRFVYGIAPRGWKYNVWVPNKEGRSPSGPSFPPHCFKMLSEWRDQNPEVRGRLGEIALRVAYVSAAANHDKEINEVSMRAALEFVTWQESIRVGYRAGMGEGTDAQCTNAILSVLEKVEGKWIKWREVAVKKNWYRKYGSRVLSATRDSLLKSGMTIEETTDDEDGKPKRTGRIRLRLADEQ